MAAPQNGVTIPILEVGEQKDPQASNPPPTTQVLRSRAWVRSRSRKAWSDLPPPLPSCWQPGFLWRLPPPTTHHAHSPAGLSIRVLHPPLTQTSRGTPHGDLCWVPPVRVSIYPHCLDPQSTCPFRSLQLLCGIWEPHHIFPVCSFELKLDNLFLLLATRSTGCFPQAGDEIHEPCLTLLLYSPCAWPRARQLVCVGEAEKSGDPGWWSSFTILNVFFTFCVSFHIFYNKLVLLDFLLKK